MMTAKEAQLESQSRMSQLAKEFITNCAADAVLEAIKIGELRATPSFEGVPNPEKVGEEVVKLLRDLGYSAEHIHYDNINGYANYILIEWEKNNEE